MRSPPAGGVMRVFYRWMQDFSRFVTGIQRPLNVCVKSVVVSPDQDGVENSRVGPSRGRVLEGGSWQPIR